jgi:hypothetical protein
MRAWSGERAVAAVLNCYPSWWKRRHHDDAVQLTTALLEDGVPWWSIAWSFLSGATREQVRHHPRTLVKTFIAASTAGLVALSVGMFPSLTAANASSASVVIVISNPSVAAVQLRSALSEHHFKITVSSKAAPRPLVGSILSIQSIGDSDGAVHTIGELHGRCAGGSLGCVSGLVIPVHFSASARVTIGRAIVSSP